MLLSSALRTLRDPRVCCTAACLVTATAADGAASSSATALRWQPNASASSSSVLSVFSSSSSSLLPADNNHRWGFAGERVLLGGSVLQMNRNDRKPRRGQKSRPVSNYLRKQKAQSHKKPKYVKPQPKALESIPSPVGAVEAARSAAREAARTA